MSAGTFPVRPVLEHTSDAITAFTYAYRHDVTRATRYLQGLDEQQLAGVEMACALLTAAVQQRREPTP